MQFKSPSCSHDKSLDATLNVDKGSNGVQPGLYDLNIVCPMLLPSESVGPQTVILRLSELIM